jgi:acetyl esterase/lipase
VVPAATAALPLLYGIGRSLAPRSDRPGSTVRVIATREEQSPASWSRSPQYTTDPAERALSTVSPLRAEEDELRGLPKALVINGECDVLRDEGETYARKLRAAGVDVTATRYAGTIHDFMMLNALADTNEAKAATAQAAAFLHDALQ